MIPPTGVAFDGDSYTVVWTVEVAALTAASSAHATR